MSDICDGLIACALKGAVGEVYNLASGIEVSIISLAEKINDIIGNNAGIETMPGRDWDRSGRRFGSIEKTKKKLGFVCKTALKDGLKQTAEWFRENIKLIDECIKKHDKFMKD